MDFEKRMVENYKRVLRQGGEGGFSQVVCPSTYDKPCKLCALCYDILKDRANQGTKLREKAYSLNQKHKYYSNIVFPGVNPSQVVVFEYGDKLFGKFIGYQMDPNSDYKDWTHPLEGRNVFIKKIPGASKEKTSYDATPRANKSKLVDGDVLDKLYPLDEILSLIRAGTVKQFYQSKLEMGDTEVRVLPSWLGPGSNVFYFPANFHYGITDEEFNAIQAGDLNPFVTVIKPEPVDQRFLGEELDLVPKEKVKPQEASSWKDLLKKPSDGAVPKEKGYPETVFKVGRDGVVYQEASEEKTKVESLYPGCFGQYDPNDEECSILCAEDGWNKPCQVQTKEIEERKAKRATARRLSK